MSLYNFPLPGGTNGIVPPLTFEDKLTDIRIHYKGLLEQLKYVIPELAENNEVNSTYSITNKTNGLDY